MEDRAIGQSECAPDESSDGVLMESWFHPRRTIVLVGLMGAGKTNVGRRLAQRLGLPFVDSDAEIEMAANATVAEIFENQGESVFRAGERRVIRRLLEGPNKVLATGGGAFMDADTRALIRAQAVSVWLKADIETLLHRVARRKHRPILNKGDPREILERLIAERHPFYAEAHITVETRSAPPEATVEDVVEALRQYLASTAERN